MLENSGKSADEVQQNIANAAAAGQDGYTLADALGQSGQRAASSVVRAGEGGEGLADFLQQRQAGQSGRIADILDGALGTNGQTANMASKGLMAQAAQDAGPLYQQAFQGGSTAPLESQFQAAFADAANTSSQAAKDLAAARQQQTLARAQASQVGDNVYANSSAMEANRQADAAVAQAERAATAADANKEAIRQRLQQAQADGSANAPGAVWSPRLQQFLDDPITRSGLARGVEIQRLEALAKGEKFDPTELAITGADEAGNPVVSKVPNTRTLDVVKKGLDAMLEDYRDPMTGRLALDQRGRAIDAVRRSFLGEIDRMNPTYAQARQAWAGPASIDSAIDLGQNAATRGRAADNIATFNSLGAPQKQGFRHGYADKLAAALERDAGPATNSGRRLTSDKAQQELSALSLYQGANAPGAPDQLAQRLGREQDMFGTYQRAMTGSRTADNLADAEAQRMDPSILADLLQGRFMAAGGKAVRGAANTLTGFTPTVREHLANMLMSNGDQVAPVLSRVANDATKREALAAAIMRGVATGEGELSGRYLPGRLR